MAIYSSMDDVFKELKSKLDGFDGRGIYLLFANNTSGKTRISRLFTKQESEKVLCYNAFMEDLFLWDNENLILKVDKNSWIFRLINAEGFDTQIVDSFKKLMNSKIAPSFNLEEGEISFGNFTGDNKSLENIKISRGEESLFVWCVFYTILSKAIEILHEKPENRSTHIFDKIEYIIIDDPVSSMDDTRIITMALELIELLKEIQDLKILITTHHCLFFNVMYHKQQEKWNQYNATLLKLEDGTLEIKSQNGDSPFSYHTLLVEEIRKAINDGNVQKYHFNLFRAILEKTKNFLGYTQNWSCLLEDNKNKDKLKKLLNIYSHSSLSEIESKQILPEDLTIFKDAFETFVEKFHWSCAKNEQN